MYRNQSTTNLNLDTRYDTIRKITLNITTWIDIDFLKPLKHFTGVKWDFKRMIFWVAGEYYFRQYIYLKVYLSQKCNICTIISLHFKKICSFTGKFLNLVYIDFIKILWLPILTDDILLRELYSKLFPQSSLEFTGQNDELFEFLVERERKWKVHGDTLYVLDIFS